MQLMNGVPQHLLDIQQDIEDSLEMYLNAQSARQIDVATGKLQGILGTLKRFPKHEGTRAQVHVSLYDPKEKNYEAQQ